MIFFKFSANSYRVALYWFNIKVFKLKLEGFNSSQLSNIIYVKNGIKISISEPKKSIKRFKKFYIFGSNQNPFLKQG